jgi:serine/threonine protein kinase
VSGYLWGQHVAVKKMHVHIMSDAKKCADFLNEVEILRRLRHPNILQFMGACFEDPHFLIVTEYVGGGTLEDRIEDMAETQARMSSYTFFAINQQICKGLCWLHHKSVIHRDLKPANILIDKRLNVKIADFGLAHMKGNKTDAPGAYGAAGTPSYMAPEVLENRPYSVKADVFSHGVIMAEMLDGEYPWHAISQKSSVTFENCIIDGVRPPIPKEADDYPGLASLITSCWEAEASMRCSSDDVMEQLVSIDKACTKKEDATMSAIEPHAQKIIKDDRLRIQELEAQLNKATGRVARLETALQKSVAKKIDVVGSSSIAAATLAVDKQRAPAGRGVMSTTTVAAGGNPADVTKLAPSPTQAARAAATAEAK